MDLKRLTQIELATAILACRQAGAVNAAAALSKHIERLEADLHKARQGDPTGDLIQANRDAILEKHQEAARLIRKKVDEAGHERDKLHDIVDIIDALNSFHPMHCESWKGWPE